VLYFGCHDGKLYALNAISGKLLWTFAADGRIVSSPWPTQGVVYFGCDDGCLYAVEGK
jgi:outer membrane protein assembly factor BamB